MPETNVPITLTTTGGTITFNVYTTQGVFHVTSFQIPRPSRASADPRPMASGGILPPVFLHNYCTPVIEGQILPGNITQRAQMMDQLAAAMFSIMSTYGTLAWTPSGKATRQLPVRCFEDPILDDPVDAVVKKFHLSFVSEYPYALSATQYTADTATLNAGSSSGSWTFGSAGSPLWKFGTAGTPNWSFGTDPGGGSVICNNGGTANSYPLIRIFGSISAPVVKNVNTGLLVSLPSLSLTAGNYVEIDMRTGTVTYNGSASQNLLGFLDAGVSTLFPLVPGDNSIRLFGATFDSSAKATIIWNDAWA